MRRELATAIYYRYGTRCEREFASFDEALGFLAWGDDDGSLSADAIRDGDRVVDGDEIDRLMTNYLTRSS